MRDVIGLSGLIVGGIISGWLIAKYGLKKCIWPMALALNLPNVGYLYLAIAQPGLAVAYPLVVLEQLGYGIGFTAFMVFLMYIAKGPYKTSHYAISTGFMALGLMLPSMLSGLLQSALGYVNFFILVLLLTIPGFVLLLFIPLEEQTE
jgi:PAT family beta-lactamase induction signal transducer AmpG